VGSTASVATFNARRMVDCVVEGACLCSKNWILLVHNDFSSKGEWERLGNEADVRNLKRVFKKRSNCKLAELKNCGKDEILGCLRSKEKLIDLFHPDDDCRYLLSK
jgi:hypothetical protein